MNDSVKDKPDESSGDAVVKEHPGTKNLTSWKPGQSGNPEGKKEGTKNTSTIIREFLDMASNKHDYEATDKDMFKELSEELEGRKLTKRDIMFYKMIQKAMKGDTYTFNSLMDRLEGKPTQTNRNINTEQKYEDFIEGVAKLESENED